MTKPKPGPKGQATGKAPAATSGDVATKRRGRPRNLESPQRAKLNQAIARSAHRLMWWGVRRDDAFELVAVALRAETKARSPLTRPLHGEKSPEGKAVEKIHKEWRDESSRAWHAGKLPPGSGFEWRLEPGADWTADSRRQNYPRGTSGSPIPESEVALTLLQNGGKWPGDVARRPWKKPVLATMFELAMAGDSASLAALAEDKSRWESAEDTRLKVPPAWPGPKPKAQRRMEGAVAEAPKFVISNRPPSATNPATPAVKRPRGRPRKSQIP